MKNNLKEADWLARMKKYWELYPGLAWEFSNHLATIPGTVAQQQTAHTRRIILPVSSWTAEQRSRR